MLLDYNRKVPGSRNNVREIIGEVDARIQNLYDTVKGELEANHARLILREENVKCLGITYREEKGEVTIEIDINLNDDKKVPVLIHELGEADYIVRGLPYIKAKYEAPNSTLRRLNECFSHWHIHKLMKVHGMEDLMEDSSSANLDQQLTDNPSNNLIYLLYKICTWPDRKDEILYSDKYSTYKEDLEKILGYLDDINELGIEDINYDDYADKYEEIIKIIKNRGYEKKVELLDGRNNTIIATYE